VPAQVEVTSPSATSLAARRAAADAFVTDPMAVVEDPHVDIVCERSAGPRPRAR
jgi:hypothetical protein